jgi:FkbM family methyltransferase
MNQSEAAQVACARRMISPGDVCFDIGANVGLYTLLFSTCAQSVYAFEPLPRNLDYLRRLIAINRMGNARVMPWAMSDAGGKGYFKLGRDHSQGRLDVDGEIQVPIRTCDQFASDRGVVPDLIKIDVEGSELKVLHGARNLLQSYHPAILLSVHSDRLRRQCLAFLADLQYETAIPIDTNLEREATEFAILRKGSACSSGCRHQHSGVGGGHRS